MASATVDPFTVEIVRNALDAICEQMSTTIERTAYSTLIRDILDFSTALFDARGRIIAQGSRIPAHLNTMGPALETVLARYLPAAEWQARRRGRAQRSLPRRPAPAGRLHALADLPRG